MRISGLLGAVVIAEDGEELGHVHDVRARRLGHRNADGHGLRLTGLIVGLPGVRERLGIATRHRPMVQRRQDFIAWERVAEIAFDEDGTVIHCRR